MPYYALAALLIIVACGLLVMGSPSVLKVALWVLVTASYGVAVLIGRCQKPKG